MAAFAAPLHVRLVPAFQTLGHYENYLLDPANFDLAEFPGAQCLCPSAEPVRAFLRDALGEVAAAFPDTLFNVGCDESWDVGRGKSRARVRAEGLTAVHAEHYRLVHDIVRPLGRRMLMYGDIILNNPKILYRIPRDIVIVDWHYEAAESYPSVARFRGAGFDVIVSPGISGWSRFYPNSATALDNIENLTREGWRQGALGAVTSSWCDFGAPNLRQTNLFHYAFAAACAWNPGNVDREALARDFWSRFFAAGDPESFIRLDKLLAGIGRSAYDDWWRHPALGPSPRGMTGQRGNSSAAWGVTLQARMAEARNALEAARAGVKANSRYLDYLSLALDMGDLLGAKFRWMAACAAGGGAKLSVPEAAALADSARSLRQRMAALRPRYAALWLRANRPEGLDNILSLWDRQLLYWDSIIGNLERNRTVGPSGIASAWIAPAAGLAAKKQTHERSAYYSGVFTVPSGVDSVKMQIMGESDVTALANGAPAGRKVARLCLSEIVDRRRAVLFDITDRLKPGRNRLTVSVTNYEGKVPALNVYGEMYSAGKLAGTFGTDTAWRAAELPNPPAGWGTPAFQATAWEKCGVYPPDKPVSRPFFDAGLPSRVER